MDNNSIKKNIGQTIGYEGVVTVSAFSGDRLQGFRRFHNEGKAKLFKFLSDCLIGDYRAAESSRPCRVVLFGSTDGQADINKKISSYVFYDAAPSIVLNDDGGYSSINYHFRLPYLALKTNEYAYACGLYPAVISDIESDMCAYFKFDDPIEIPSTDSNTTIVID